MIESTVDGRYQVIAKIASGGMGEVYRAHDAVLGREVALKVLHPQLAGDRGFVDRFRREARAAAILNHPNIVGVYDWGTTDGTYFMVMEFVRGHNLRALLVQYNRLEPLQVVEASLPVLAALDHAHGHGIVHRDIKPENILISQDGTVKVADFGLARAFADSYVSQAEGTVTGTVQYLAPEQIQGEPADPRTDLYALGVVIFELLTGHPPFAGETSLAIAYKHLSERVPAPSEESAAIAPSLDGIVRHATEKDREGRPPSARAMREEMTRTAVGLPPAAPLRDLAAQIPTAEFVTEERAPTVTIPRALSPRARRRQRFQRIAVLAALVALLVAGLWSAWVYAIPHYTHVPNVQGLSVKQATARLQGLGLRVSVGDPAFSHSVPAGQVVGTSPPAGSKIRKRSQVVVIPSKGRDLVTVPSVANEKQKVATQTLQAAGFDVEVVHDYDENISKGNVVRQDPENATSLERGQTVTITVSLGPHPVKIPNVAGRPAQDARAVLEDAGFVVEETDQFSVDVTEGDVIRTEPPAGQSIPRGGSVTMIVSKGPKPFPMPSVLLLKAEDARTQLEGLGLIVTEVRVPGSNGDTVVGQDPLAGTPVRQGQTVTIYIGR